MKMNPIRFTPFLRTMVWGGEKIAAYKGIETDIRKIGESWEISGYGEHPTLVAEGPDAGLTVNELVCKYGARLVGGKVYADYGDQFPLLIKFIDAAGDLSIQVHPDDEKAERNHGKGFKGKTEMWYVIGADPGAALYCGMAAPITPEEYTERVADGTITDVLSRYEVRPGDVFFLPAGRVHAICRGCFVAEIQQTSDLTYRIYDYGRKGLDGKPRELHTELAREAIDYRVLPSYRTDYSNASNKDIEVVSCKYFTTSVLDLTEPFVKPLSELDSFLVVMCVSGEGTLIDEEPEGAFRMALRQGETVLIPATSRSVRFEPKGTMKVLTSCIK